MTYKISAPVAPADWAEPIGFGWNDWEANKWFTFMYTGNSYLRFTTASARVPGSEPDTTVGNVDGIANQYWGPVIADISTEKTITITVELGGNIVAYVDGNAVLTYETPADYTFSDPTLQFAMGCAGHWGGQYWWTGELSNVAIYDFALTEEQVKEYMVYGNVYSKEEIEYVYAVESMTDLTSLVKVPINSTNAEILAYAPKTSIVQVKMSDDTLATSNVSWDSIAVIDGERYLEGNITDLTNPNCVKAYAKILFIDEASIFLPIAKYEFLDPANPGKDTMGNFDLNLIYASGYTSSNGGISVSNGVATFNGTAGLVSGSEENDLTEKLGSFTLTYKIKSGTTNSGWAIPVGFGYDDWTPNKWFTFTMLGGSSMLRFTAASSRIPGIEPETMVSDVDGLSGQWWGAELGYVETTKTITVTVELGGNIVVYVDGDAILIYKTPADYSMSSPILQFALGCAGQWGGQNFFVGEISDVTIYGAVLNEQQVKMLSRLSNIKTDLMEKPYIIDVSNIPLFEGASTKNPLAMDMSLVEMLENLNPATVLVTLSDNSEMNLNIVWTSVVKNGNVYTAMGEVNTLYCGVLTIVPNVIVEYNLTIHTFGVPVYTWSDDYSTCTATQISELDSSVTISETMNSSFTVVDPTCTVGQTTVYIVIFDKYEYQTQVIEVISGNPLGHVECVDKCIEPTCTTIGISEGKHCSVCNEVLVQQQIIEAKDHLFDEIVYEWSQDYSVCIATATCANDSNHKIQEVVHTTKSVIEASVETEGSITYTAEFENELFKVQTNVQTIEKLSNPNDSKKGCSGAIVGTFGVICLLTAFVVVIKKKKNYNL